MTKLQMQEAALQLMSEHKANKKLTEALTGLFEQYSSKANSDTVKREQNITVDGNEYRWCNRHEIYEPVTNFVNMNKKTVACKLASKAWAEYGKEIKALEEKRDALILEEKYDEVKPVVQQVKELKELRGGRYNFEDDSLKYNDIEDYIYDESKFIKED